MPLYISLNITIKKLQPSKVYTQTTATNLPIKKYLKSYPVIIIQLYYQQKSQ